MNPMEMLTLILTSEATITFVTGFAKEYIAQKTTDKILDVIKNKFKNDSFEYLLISALNESLEATCNHFGWEYDADAITETFIMEWPNLNSVASKDGLKTILQDATAMDVSDAILSYWIDSFSQTVSNPKYQWIYNYINNDLVVGTKQQGYSVEYSEIDIDFYVQKNSLFT